MAATPTLPEVTVERGGLADRSAQVLDLLDPSVTDAVAVPVAPSSAVEDGEVQPRPGTADAATRYGIDLFEWAQREGVRGTPGEAVGLRLPRVLAGREEPVWSGLPERLVLVGVGDGGTTALRRAGAALARATEGHRRVVTTAVAEAPGGVARAFVEGFLLAAYRPPRSGLGDGPRPPARHLVLLGATDDGEVTRAARAARATWTARRLAATPSSTKNPAWLADQAIRIAADAPGTTVTVHAEDWLAEHGFGGLLAVGGGSATPPRLVVLDYVPEVVVAASRHVVLVGKGITFDTGGLSIKNRDAMVGMKTDMAGAAAVLAAAVGAAEAGVPHRVTAVLPLAENAVGSGAYRPGDVIRLVDGTSVEVRNTDAEGRLVLADALAWARRTYAADAYVDIATLTGAATMGLGRRHGALYGEDPALAASLLAAGESTGEALWQMPLVEEYRAALDTPVADLANVATDPHVHAGSITAALFLRHVMAGSPWAHLDIAGPARAPKTEHEVAEGPSGFGARLLLRWLEDLSA